jgi:penicillin-binding protein 2
LQIVRDAMADVVNGAGGTAHKAALPGITVCAKTGTAQVVGNKGSLVAGEDEDKMPEKYRDHAWLIAFAPKEHPQIAIACLVEHGGHGGSASAPAVHDVMQRFFQLYPVQEPTPELTEDSTPRPAIAHVLEDDTTDTVEER